MPHHEERKYLPYSPEQMFNLVANVEVYPEFLPWLVSARVYDRRENSFQADLIVGFKVFKERFTSRVTLDNPRHVRVDYIKGPLRYLHNDWTFHDVEDGAVPLIFVWTLNLKAICSSAWPVPFLQKP
ncbi:ubiquinone-binding protein [Iodidimonas gelatinilytica]|uniref:Ubiquinone-binding protein n=1 Tax=Iodidimonas gelatinilytica TaxID=1236966 RepID=A0A5A7MM45_9PROT|nr:type II toxin-antitoxin system RatA family toxin [Iodidimonas gelatinilytica]GEQ96724.1 ubiquinone-binding protein [Iodidimonas gelatinilytica]